MQEPRSELLRLHDVRGSVALALLLALLHGCGGPPSPTPPASVPTPDLPTFPLPPGVAGIPGPGDVTFDVAPHTPPGSVPVGVEQSFRLGHCGLISPIDVDGGLWDPVSGDDGAGGPLTEAQLGELINATPTVIVLIDPQTMLLVTQRGARILLTRHDGPRAYLGCD